MVRVIVAALALLIGSCAIAKDKPGTPEAKDAMEFVCAQLKADCSKLPVPTVNSHPIVCMAGLHGVYFFGEDQIWVCPESNKRELVVHEITHYVIWKLDPSIGRCTSEYWARIVGSNYIGEPYDDSWRKGYGCPAPE